MCDRLRRRRAELDAFRKSLSKTTVFASAVLQPRILRPLIEADVRNGASTAKWERIVRDLCTLVRALNSLVPKCELIALNMARLSDDDFAKFVRKLFAALLQLRAEYHRLPLEFSRFAFDWFPFLAAVDRLVPWSKDELAAGLDAFLQRRREPAMPRSSLVGTELTLSILNASCTTDANDSRGPIKVLPSDAASFGSCSAKPDAADPCEDRAAASSPPGQMMDALSMEKENLPLCSEPEEAKPDKSEEHSLCDTPKSSSKCRIPVLRRELFEQPRELISSPAPTSPRRYETSVLSPRCASPLPPVSRDASFEFEDSYEDLLGVQTILQERIAEAGRDNLRADTPLLDSSHRYTEPADVKYTVAHSSSGCEQLLHWCIDAVVAGSDYASVRHFLVSLEGEQPTDELLEYAELMMEAVRTTASEIRALDTGIPSAALVQILKHEHEALILQAPDCVYSQKRLLPKTVESKVPVGDAQTRRINACVRVAFLEKEKLTRALL